MIDRRSLITGLISLVAVPAIVRVSSIMPVKVFEHVDVLPYKLIGIDYGDMDYSVIFTHCIDGRIIIDKIPLMELYTLPYDIIGIDYK